MFADRLQPTSMLGIGFTLSQFWMSPWAMLGPGEVSWPFSRMVQEACTAMSLIEHEVVHSSRLSALPSSQSSPGSSMPSLQVARTIEQSSMQSPAA